MSRFRNPRTLMVQGTTSDAGKSVIVTAACRILARAGHGVAPFKPQNMALNSAVTVDGGEIGRAQAVQAQAAMLEPTVSMNPVLLKPTGDQGAQVIVAGRAIGNMSAVEYHAYKPKLLRTVVEVHERLARAHEFIVVEGAGSPAEINLREHDIANMGFAEAVDCPVIVVADIDRGGVFAHLYGTWALLSASEKARMAGFVINRFRGDPALLDSGIRWLVQRTGVPVLGVIPYLHRLHIEAEDSITRDQAQQQSGTEPPFRVVVPKYPRASNHTDFDVLRMHPAIDCRFLHHASEYDGAELIVLPGSKNVRGDLAWLRENGWEEVIQRHLRYGGRVIGICGGYQMLGRMVHDPKGIESGPGSSPGLGLLDQETTLHEGKTLRNVSGVMGDTGLPVRGYEIHAGTTTGGGTPLFRLVNAKDADDSFDDGSLNDDGRVMGTYLHGLFDQPEMLRHWLEWAGMSAVEPFDYDAFRDQQIDRLADAVAEEIPLDTWLGLLSTGEEESNQA